MDPRRRRDSESQTRYPMESNAEVDDKMDNVLAAVHALRVQRASCPSIAPVRRESQRRAMSDSVDNEDLAQPFAELSDYEMRHLVAHLTNAERPNDVYRLLTLEGSGGHNAWFEAK